MAATPSTIDSAIEMLDQRLQKCMSARECAWALTDAAIQAYRLPDCVTYLLNADGRSLTQVAAYGPKIKLGQALEYAITLRVDQGIVGSAASSQRAVRVDDSRLDPRYVLDDAHRLSELAVPIVYQGALYGVLDMEHEERAFFDLQHEQGLSRMASITGRRLAALGEEPAH
jgi:signal transduction protein with GAF and PtsI domain